MKKYFNFNREYISGTNFLLRSIFMMIAYVVVNGSLGIVDGKLIGGYQAAGLLVFAFIGVWFGLSATYQRIAQFTDHPLAVFFGAYGMIFGNAPGTKKSKKRPEGGKEYIKAHWRKG